MSNNVTTNTTSSAGGQQQYGIDIDSANALLNRTYGYQDIVFTARSGEGVFSGQLTEQGELVDKFITSRTIIKTLDLVSEGEIEGLVSGEYEAEGHNPAGQLGFDRRPFRAYAGGQAPETFLRSVYLNDTPVVNSNNLYNFQSCEMALFNGAPEGIQPDDDFLSVGSSNTLEKTRVIEEKLAGPDIDPENDPPTGGNALEKFFYHPKVYRIFNRHLHKIRVNIKVTALSFTKQGDEFPLDRIGDVVGSKLTFKYRYRPLYYDRDSGIVDHDDSADWYGSGGIAGGGEPLVSHVDGLIRSAFIHKKEIEPADELKKDNLAGWEIEITRTTFDSIQSNIVNESYVESLTELYEDTFSYPSSAIVSMNFNAEFFSQVPNRAYDLRLLKVKVPEGYDPITKNYAVDTDGREIPWNGNFQKKADGTYDLKWTDNPAWIYYDLLTNRRYGVGKHLGFEGVEIDKWTLHEISKFCDVLVADGKGATEPRFTANTLINSREDAFKVLKDFASVFRSITYYGLGSIHAIQDRPREEVAQFTNANVENGDFFYSSTAQTARPTAVLVRYNDSTNFYRTAVEYVEDTEGIRKYGVVEKEVTAFACTSRAQAIRVGRWILATNAAQTEAINFTVGAEGMLLRPGDVVRVADQNRSDYRFGGRVINHGFHDDKIHTKDILLDRDLTTSLETNKDYTIFLTTPSYFYDTSLVNIGDGADTPDIRKAHVQSFTFNEGDSDIIIQNYKIGEDVDGDKLGTLIHYVGLPSDGKWMFESSTVAGSIVDDATWSIIDNDYSNNLYNIISTSEEQRFKYKVQAIIHEPLKYDFVDLGTPYSFVPTATNTTLAPPGPKGLILDVIKYNASAASKKVEIEVQRPTNSEGDPEIGTTIGYKIYVKEGDWNPADMVSETSSRPKPEYFFKTVFLTDLKHPQTGNPITYYVPPRNEKTYYFRVFAVNSTSVLSSGRADDNVYVEDHYPVKDIKIHSLRLQSGTAVEDIVNPPADKTRFANLDNKDFAVQWDASFLNEASINLPIKYRVSIHEPSANSTPGTEIQDAVYITAKLYFNYNFDTNRSEEGGPRRHIDLVVQAIDEEGNLSAEALNPATDAEGWDIIEIFNGKPKDFQLTPRKNNGKRVGDHICCDNYCEAITTEQYIDADGNVVLKTYNNSFNDLAGGYMYLSKHPFSGNDFNPDGSPNNSLLFRGIELATHEAFKEEDYLIQEIPFEADKDNLLTSKIVISPPSVDGTSEVFDFASAYYMALKFYDSFDREIKREAVYPVAQIDTVTVVAGDIAAGGGKTYSVTIGATTSTVTEGSEISNGNTAADIAAALETKINNAYNETVTAEGVDATIILTSDLPGLPFTSSATTDDTGAASMTVVTTQENVIGRNEDWNDDAWIGFARDHESIDPDQSHKAPNVYKKMYQMSSLTSGLFIGNYDVGAPSCTTGTFAVPMWPTKYFSASAENGFKYWIRININGQWEGNGISRVKALTYKDTDTLYGYQGYYEYSCYMSEVAYGYSEDGYPYSIIKPNELGSHTRCRFRQGQRDMLGDIYAVDHYQISYGPWYGYQNTYPTYVTTGATRPPGGVDPTRAGYSQQDDRVWQPLPRAGVPYGGWGRTYTNPQDAGVAPSYEGGGGARPDIDKIDTYNWRGEKVEGKSKPLYGFRRFRVYFDPKNLPPKPEKEQLSAYAVIGMNSWNGSYESWPGRDADDIARSILAAKDEVLPGYGATDEGGEELEGTYPISVRSWLKKGDLFENIPGVWAHHAAGFGAGFGGLIKQEGYFDIHMGRLIDDTYLNEAFFGVVATNDYSILDSTVLVEEQFDQRTGLHEATWSTNEFVTLTFGEGGDGIVPYPDLPDWEPYPSE